MIDKQPMTLLKVMFASRFLDIELVRWQMTYPDGRKETQWELLHYGDIMRIEDYHWKQYKTDDEHI